MMKALGHTASCGTKKITEIDPVRFGCVKIKIIKTLVVVGGASICICICIMYILGQEHFQYFRDPGFVIWIEIQYFQDPGFLKWLEIQYFDNFRLPRPKIN